MSKKVAGVTGVAAKAKVATAAVPAVQPQVPAAAPAAGSERKSGLDLAYEVLAESGKPMNQRQLAEAVIARGWATNGKTPGSTLYVRIIGEIKSRGDASRFARAQGVKGSFVAVSSAV